MLLLRDEFKSVMQFMGKCIRICFTVHKSYYHFSTFRLFIDPDAPGWRVRCISISLLNRILVRTVLVVFK